MPPDEIVPPPPVVDAPPAAPPAPDPMHAKLAAMEQRLAQYDAVMMQVAQGQQGGGHAAPPPPNPEPGGYVDPDLQRLLDQQRATFQGAHAQQVDRLDSLEFRQHVAEAGYTDEQKAAAEKVYQAWRSNNVTINGAPPSRMDALNYALGMVVRQQSVTARQAAAQAEALRRTQNMDALVERSGYGGLSVPADIDSLPRKERSAKLAAILDKEGF